ncbi:TRPV5 [Lepeophtheirus salmonis]|uniref:TRPV5 n=1 Tax=Lepeophtheirus salmonis TaxID=72036 RepID=A0A7R8H0Q6_LEPSM|nr:TRPV5 [Lepeophtheirus salmonis]CAF2775005.1 TRPV5 [Lepeophtheirus salmonis]
MGNTESNESDAVKRQAEGGGNFPMYELLDLGGGGSLMEVSQRAMVKKDFKELDEVIRSKVTPYLYNGGNGKMVPVIHLALLRNKGRPRSKQSHSLLGGIEQVE